MKKIYEEPQIIVTAFASEGIMSPITVSNVAPTSVAKSASRTVSLGQLK